MGRELDNSEALDVYRAECKRLRDGIKATIETLLDGPTDDPWMRIVNSAGDLGRVLDGN